MATILYKDGKQIAVNYDALKRHLNAGWSTSKDAPKPKAEVEPKAENEVVEKPKPKRRATRKKV